MGGRGLPALAIVAGSAMLVTASIAPVQNAPRTPQSKVRAPHQHRPAKIRDRRVDGSYESTNWSGYAATGSNFTQVAGTWKVPASTCSKGSSAEYAAFWIGLDGWTSDSVEQTGTDSDCSNGTPSYYAWYEFYPEASYYAPGLTNLSVGDVIVASVTYNAAKAQFTATIEDTTKKIAYSATFTPNKQTGTPARSSAEWIAEAPSQQVGRQLEVLPLADFKAVDFGPDFFTTTGANSATIGTASPTLMGAFGSSLNSSTMVTESTGAPMATPSAVTSDNSSFYVTWNSVGP
jgi:Peptidase A4 family